MGRSLTQEDGQKDGAEDDDGFGQRLHGFTLDRKIEGVGLEGRKEGRKEGGVGAMRERGGVAARCFLI